ncbi:MAG: hypothetical protein R3B72_26615 [Polyangiaceae bacterium]
MKRPLAAMLTMVTLGLCACDDGKSGEETAGAKAPATGDATAAATGEGAGVSPEVKAALAALEKQQLPLASKNYDRDAVCGHMRVLAEAARDCSACVDTYAKIIEGEGKERIVDCSAQDLTAPKAGAERLCKALVASWKNTTQRNSRAIEGMDALGAACKPQLDDFVEVLTTQFAAYDNSYGDLGPANLVYVERLLDHMTPEQKKKVAEAARKLETLAREKKDRSGKISERTAEQAKKLAEAAST